MAQLKLNSPALIPLEESRGERPDEQRDRASSAEPGNPVPNILAACSAAWLLLAGCTQYVRGESVDFAHQVVPILREHCGSCHTGSERQGGFSINDRRSLLAGGDGGPAAVPGNSAQSELVRRVASEDDGQRMPPEGDPLAEEKIELLRRWIDSGAPWEPGFSFGPLGYEPPLRPRRPELPAARDGRTHPIDRIVDAYLAEHGQPLPQPIADAAFLRRASLDLLGQLPPPESLDAFLADRGADKRARLIKSLLADDVAYADCWLSFWNDLLRNDYAGTGFITKGRKQITEWLYQALRDNQPYDQFARELIAPRPESEGFIQGIRWRGDVSSSQTPEVQFAQNVSQAFLGINLKCASCHNSFIDRWTLDETYGLAAIYATAPLEIHRCDKPTGAFARAAWMFPELGQVSADAPQPERLRQLAELMTHRENGRFTRTIANRLWHRLLGRGLVHPVDAMQTEPWSEDLLDYLAVSLADQGYDLKQLIELICTSQAYQAEVLAAEQPEDGPFVYRGPRVRRMTAEQFVDAVWQLTGTAPQRADAAVDRRPRGAAAENRALPVRASLVKSTTLMRSLGRPNRDQIVSTRPAELTTLEAIDLANEAELAEAIARGAERALHGCSSADELVGRLFREALSRSPTEDERQAALELLGEQPSAERVADLIWAVLMLPEFQLVR